MGQAIASRKELIMIPLSTIITFALAAVCTLLLPIVLIIVFAVKKKISGLPLLLGAAAFFVSQICLRMPLLNLLAQQDWYVSMASNIVPFIFFLAFTAGLFEESARLGGAMLLKKQRSYKDRISFGLGHGFCEAILLVGFSHVSNTMLCLLINSGVGLSAIAPDVLETAAAQLMAVVPTDILWGVLERFSTVIFHIFATVLVFQGVKRGKLGYYFLAILAHTLVNFVSILLARYGGMFISEMVLFLAALGMGVYILLARGTERE
jgi:uncharacterized membrane protein YhfC